MNYKFEQLTVWNLALELSDYIYQIANSLPEVEKFNLNSQICRASTSMSLSIAEVQHHKMMQNKNDCWVCN